MRLGNRTHAEQTPAGVKGQRDALVAGGTVNLPSVPEAGSAHWEIGMSESPWHRHVSPIFFLLLVVDGLMLGFVAFFLLPEVAHAVGG
jgi:hypothetical protein